MFVGTGAIVAGANSGGVPQAELALAWFAAVAIPVVILARISGAHINPAVSLALVVARRLHPRELAPYVSAQVGGAFVGSALVGLLVGRSAHWGATIPRNGDVILVAPLEFGFTAALVLTVLYLTTDGKAPSHLELLLPAAVVGLSTFFIGPWTGSSLNPARTIAPAVFSGDYFGIWVYLVVIPVAAVFTATVATWRR